MQVDVVLAAFVRFWQSVTELASWSSRAECQVARINVKQRVLAREV